MDERKTVFLLRAFGDFIIAIHIASQSNIRSKITLVASEHLEPLYSALPVVLPSNISISFFDCKIRYNLLSCFTDRFLFSRQAIRELLALRKYFHKTGIEGIGYLEQKKRIFFPRIFTGYPFRYILSDQNVYKAYTDFFNVSIAALQDLGFITPKKGMKILIVPEARQNARNISNELIKKIVDPFKSHKAVITVAYFKNKKNSSEGIATTYNSFSELVNLVKDTDLFIGCDSMPVHLAQMMKKPHYILYPAYVKSQFFTPFALKNSTHFSFEEIAAGKTLFSHA